MLAAVSATGSRAAAQERSTTRGYVPETGFIPDSITAVRVAEAVLTPIYSDSVVTRERPFRAKLEDGVWTVVGSLPPAKPGEAWLGGVAWVEIRKSDGAILRLWHEK